MVVAVEVTADSSLISIRVDEPTNAENNNLLAVVSTSTEQDDDEEEEEQPPSYYLSARDTSHTSRGALDNTRLSVNTHDSILNIAEEEEEEDEDEGILSERSFLFEDEMTQENSLNQSMNNRTTTTFFSPPTPPRLSSQRCCDPLNPTQEVTTNTNDCLLEKVTERFVDSLCFPQKEISDRYAESYRRMLEVDIFELLGCGSSPDADEIQKVWAGNHSILFCNNNAVQQEVQPSPRRPKRKSLRDRALRVNRLRSEQAMPQKMTGMSPTSVVVLGNNRTRSMDDRILQTLRDPMRICKLEDDLEKHIGGIGIDPILPEDEEIGYDSDPGDVSFQSSSEQPQVQVPRQPSPLRKTKTGAPLDSEDVHQVVQETLNLTWTLTLHPKDVSRKHHQLQPVCCSVWIERGTLVQNNTVMLEPNLMWREAYQPDICKRKLSESSQNPYSIRLLNLVRIVEAPANLDRSTYPLARPSCSFFVRTADNDDFLFEAASPKEREDIMRRWKHCVARFASLAVMEDMTTICDEFFAPIMTNSVLLPSHHQYQCP